MVFLTLLVAFLVVLPVALFTYWLTDKTLHWGPIPSIGLQLIVVAAYIQVVCWIGDYFL